MRGTRGGDPVLRRVVGVGVAVVLAALLGTTAVGGVAVPTTDRTAGCGPGTTEHCRAAAAPVTVERLGENTLWLVGGGGAAGETLRASLPTTAAAETTGVSLDSVGFALGAPASSFSAAVTTAPRRLDSAPPDPVGTEGLAYFDVRSRDLSGSLDGLEVRFSVDRDRLGGNVTPESVALFVREADGWDAVETRVVDESADSVTYAATAPGVGFFTVAPRRPVLEVSSVSVTNETAVAGRPIQVNATVENTGYAEGTLPASLTVNGSEVATRSVAVPANGRETVTFRHAVETPGNHTLAVGGRETRVEVLPAVARLSVTDLDLSRESVAAGESVEVRATVANEGTIAGTYVANLTAFGETVARERVEVPPGENRTVAFSQQFDAAGTYTVEVGNASAEVQVSARERATTTGADSGGRLTDLGGPGFGAAPVLLAGGLLAGAGLLRRRRD